MNKYLLRRATIKDIPEMQKVIKIAMTQYADLSGIKTPLESLLESFDDLKSHIENDMFLLAFHKETLVGTLRISDLEISELTDDIKDALIGPCESECACVNKKDWIDITVIDNDSKNECCSECVNMNILKSDEVVDLELSNLKLAYISRFAVLPEMQSLGVGSALFNSANEYLIRNSYVHAMLHTAINNFALVNFYKKRDFNLVSTSTDRGYLRGTFVKRFV